jgi:hypothetical protein
MKLNDLLNETIQEEEETQYIVLDVARPGRSWIADSKKDVVDAIMTNAIKKWQVLEAGSDDIIADYHHDTIYSGTITPKDKSLDKIKELMFSVDDDLPDTSAFPKVKADMEVLESDTITLTVD